MRFQLAKFRLLVLGIFASLGSLVCLAADKPIDITLAAGALKAPLPKIWIADDNWRISGDGADNADSESPVITFQHPDLDSSVSVALLDETIEGDFRYEARIKIFGDLSNYSGLVLFAKSPSEIIRFYPADNGKLWSWSKENGNVELASGTTALPIYENTWYWLRVDFVAGNLTISISKDGEDFSEVLNHAFADGPPPLGMVGLAGSAHVNFDGIKLTALPR